MQADRQARQGGTSGTEKIPVVLAAKSFPGEGTKHRREERSRGRKKKCYCYVFFLSALDFNWPSPLLSYKPPTFLSSASSSPLLDFLSFFSSAAKEQGERNQQERKEERQGKDKKGKEKVIDGFVSLLTRRGWSDFPSSYLLFILDSICHPSVHRDSATPRQRLIFA